jgi:tight adherence protein C
MFVYLLYLADRAKDTRKEPIASLADGGHVYLDEEMAKPLFQRLFRPLATSIGSFFARMTPKAMREMFEGKIIAAGGFQRMGVDEFLAVWCGVAVLFTVGSFLLFTLARLPAGKAVGFSLMVLIVCLLLPMFLLNYRISVRRSAIEKALPSVLDLMCVSVTAGLAFDGALARVVENMKGPLVDECMRMLQEIQIGVPRRTALKRMGDRCGVQDVSLFTAALIQADQLGVSISKVLEVQARSVREKRRQSVREVAMKAPVKLVFPLIFFIFPALMIVLLGPAVVTILRTLLQ